MTDLPDSTKHIGIIGSGWCIPNEDLAMELGFENAAIDVSILPAMIRRRTSIATRVAITAAARACSTAETGNKLPAIFVSCVGEMQVTDKLCQAIARQDYPLSPSLFHNSVHNTATGYWSLATGNMASMQAMGALEDGFALGLLEAWCQIQTIADQVLLVIYDEAMPEHLLPDYSWEPCAFALVLDANADSCPQIQQPFQPNGFDETPEVIAFEKHSPAMAALPLFQSLQNVTAKGQEVTLSSGTHPWMTCMILP